MNKPDFITIFALAIILIAAFVALYIVWGGPALIFLLAPALIVGYLCLNAQRKRR